MNLLTKNNLILIIISLGIFTILISNQMNHESTVEEFNVNSYDEIEKKISNNNYEYAAWVWSSLDFLKMNKIFIIDVADYFHFNTIYISVDDLLQKKERARIEYFQELHTFISYAKTKNITIDIVVGDPTWIYPENHNIPYKFIELVIDYNKKYPAAKIHGIQYDIEPHVLSDYEENKDEILKNFISLIDGLSDYFKKNNVSIGFGVVLPHFYDKKQRWTNPIIFNNSSLYVFDHLVNSLDKLDNSSIILMAYRNFFNGDNGVKGLVSDEFLSTKDKKIKIVIAQEAGNVKPEYVTFYGLDKEIFLEQLNKIYMYYKSYDNFVGIAVNDLSAYIKLKK